MRQSPSGPWLWLIRVLVTMPQFPSRLWGPTVVRVHVSFLILSLNLCKGLAPPGYSSPKTRDLRKLKTLHFWQVSQDPYPPWCWGTQPSPLSTWLPFCAAHRPTNPFWAALRDLGLASARPARASSHRNGAVMAKKFFLKEISKEELLFSPWPTSLFNSPPERSHLCHFLLCPPFRGPIAPSPDTPCILISLNLGATLPCHTNCCCTKSSQPMLSLLPTPSLDGVCPSFSAITQFLPRQER